MLKKILISIVLFVFSVSSSFAANGFFFEGGIGSRLIDGTMDFNNRYNTNYQSEFELSRAPLNEAPLDNSVTDNGTLGWDSRLVGNYNATIGFRLSHKLVTSLSIHYVHNKAGFGVSSSNNFPNLNTELGENIQRNSAKSKFETSWFSQLSLRATQSIYVNKTLFLIGGVEYSYLKLKKGTGYQRTSGLLRNNHLDSTYNDNTFGLLVGLGYELSMSSNISLMTTGLYSFSSYKGDDLYYRGLDFNIGGLELGYSLRYYLK